jgi:hypothetical protein
MSSEVYKLARNVSKKSCNLYSITVHITTMFYKNWRVCNFITAIYSVSVATEKGDMDTEENTKKSRYSIALLSDVSVFRLMWVAFLPKPVKRYRS